MRKLCIPILHIPDAIFKDSIYFNKIVKIMIYRQLCEIMLSDLPGSKMVKLNAILFLKIVSMLTIPDLVVNLHLKFFTFFDLRKGKFFL